MISLLLFGIALAARAAVGSAFAGPAYPDSYYYVHVAEQLAAGHGFITDYVWNLDDVGGTLPAVGQLPIAANAYWMPLAELVQVPTIWLLGPGPLASALPFWVVGALAAPLTYWIGRDAGFGRAAAVAAAVMVAVPAGLTPFMSQPDNFGLFMTLGALALWLCARGARGDRRAFVLGGLVVGLATLARPDGALLGLPFALVGARGTWRQIRGREQTIGWLAAVACAALFMVVVVPWLYRQLEVFGSIVPSANSGRTLWLTEYQQLFSFAGAPTAEAFFAEGLPGLVASRLGALLSAFGLVAFLPLAVVLAPFAIVGAWVSRSNPAFAPFFVYALALFAVMSIAFAVLVPHGTFIHAAAALVPHTFLLVIAGIASVVGWVARRRRTWNAQAATRIFTAAAVAIAVLAAVLQTVTVTRHWSDVRAVHEAVVGPLRDSPLGDRFMAVDPGAIRYLSGHQGVVTPYDALPVIEDVLRAYNVRWLILESESIMPALAPLLTGQARPAWLSAPLVTVSPQPGDLATRDGEAAARTPDVPAAALYAVCLTPQDTRCEP